MPITKVAAIPARRCLRKRKDQHEDRAGARRSPTAKIASAARPAAGAGKLIRRRPMRMAAMLVVYLARLAVRRIGVIVVMIVLMIMLIMRVIVMRRSWLSCA